MLQRCGNPKNLAYERYGGRGITVCERWRSFENFLADMGEKPPKLTLERIDNNGPYGLRNCRWATYREQGSNKRNNHLIELNGEFVTIAEATRRTGVGGPIIRWRLKKGRNPFVDAPRGAMLFSPNQRRENGVKGAKARWG